MVKENVPISENDIFRIPFNKIESNDQRLRLLEEFEKEFHLPSGQSRVCVAVFEDVDSADINIFQRYHSLLFQIISLEVVKHLFFEDFSFLEFEDILSLLPQI